jgi:hypothetical protein
MASSVPSLEDSAAHADRRSHPRVAVALPAFVHANGERHAVQVLDLSAGGAKLQGNAIIPAGAAVTLDCGTLGRAAVVRWQQDTIMGICFDIELDAREVAAHVQRSKALAAWRKARE